MGHSIKILKSGLLTTIQDQGRNEYLSSALSQGGAQDLFSLEIANRLVGNAPGAAGLEITGLGPTIYFEKQLCIACYGAPLNSTLTNSKKERIDFPQARPVVLSAGSTVHFGSFIRGFRAWVAFSGGIEAPTILGSKSSHLAAEIGPGRLENNVELSLGGDADRQTALISEKLRSQLPTMNSPASPNPGCISPRWSIANHLLDQWPRLDIPVLRGRHFDRLSQSQQTQLLQQEWRVDSRSNRQGLALEGQALDTSGMPSIASEPVRFGTVQLPPGGKPFVLMAEHQTTGGYPRVLEVVSAVRPLLAQASPDCRLRFVLIDGSDSDRLDQDREKDIALTRLALETLLG